MRRNKPDWVVVGGRNGELGHCTRCGEGLTIGTQRINVAAAAMEAFVESHSTCRDLGMSPDQVEDRLSWITGRDTGISSKTIYFVFTGTPQRDYSVPWDPSDFGRCYRLLKLYPEWVPRLREVGDRFPAWKGLVDSWARLTEMYEAGLKADDGHPLYNEMKRLLGRQ